MDRKGEGREGRERVKEREGIRGRGEGKENGYRPSTIFGLKVALYYCTTIGECDRFIKGCLT